MYNIFQIVYLNSVCNSVSGSMPKIKYRKTVFQYWKYILNTLGLDIQQLRTNKLLSNSGHVNAWRSY